MTSSGESNELDDRIRLEAAEGALRAPDDPRSALRGGAASEAPATRAEEPQGPADDWADQTPAPRGTPPRWLRRALFMPLPILLIAGDWYVTGGQVTSMDDAYVEADKVNVSTDVSGIVKEVDVAENQHVEAGQILFVLDDLPFRLALRRAEAQVGMTGDSLNALKAHSRDIQVQIKHGLNDVRYFATEARRQQDLLSAHVASQSSHDAAHRNLENAQQKLASLNQQLAAIGANLNAVAQRDEAAWQLAHTIVTVPFSGIVTNVRHAVAPPRGNAARR